jgi:hypothetical protein
MLNHVKAPMFDSDPPQNLPVFSRVALHNEEYVRPEMLKWMALGKEEHREKEELKKLAMKAGIREIMEEMMEELPSGYLLHSHAIDGP